jgi:uncharacterized protein (DUF1778 family)
VSFGLKVGLVTAKKESGLKTTSDYQVRAMANAQKKQNLFLSSQHRQAIDVVEAAGGTVSEFAIELASDAARQGLSDKEIIERLKQHYQADE